MSYIQLPLPGDDQAKPAVEDPPLEPPAETKPLAPVAEVSPRETSELVTPPSKGRGIWGLIGIDTIEANMVPYDVTW